MPYKKRMTAVMKKKDGETTSASAIQRKKDDKYAASISKTGGRDKKTGDYIRPTKGKPVSFREKFKGKVYTSARSLRLAKLAERNKERIR